MKVFGVGESTLLHLGVVERFPEPDFPREFSQFSTQGGGTAATTLVLLSRWGIPTELLSKAGNDSRGQDIERSFVEEGVSSKMVLEPDAVSQYRQIVIESTTQRRQVYYTNGNVSPLTRKVVTPELLSGSTLLFADGQHVDAEISLMELAKEAGIPIVLDADTMHSNIHQSVALCDVLIASERFAIQFSGVGALERLCDSLLEKGPSTVVVTLGDEGVVAKQRGGEMIRVHAHEVEVLDVSGAGPVFDGAFIFGMLQDWPLEKMLSFANVTAGISCTGIGGRALIPSVENVLEHL